jgi:hypothetical protein
MLLSARFLNDVANVNSFEYAQVGQFTRGEAASVYFQLIDDSLDGALKGFAPSGRRYIPATGATLSVVVNSIDDAKKITRVATNPFPDDRSIWKLDFLTTDKIDGTATLQLTLTEGSVVRKGLVKNGLRIASDTGVCG